MLKTLVSMLLSPETSLRVLHAATQLDHVELPVWEWCCATSLPPDFMKGTLSENSPHEHNKSPVVSKEG